MRRSDEQIKRDISEQLAFNKQIDEAAIQVEVSDGRVTLSGTVPSYPTLSAAEKDARIVSGVQTVENRIRVEPPTEQPAVPADGEIQAAVERMLVQAPDVNIRDLALSVKSGEVVLEGSVDQLWKKFRAQEVSGIVAGVRAIHNHLVVVPSESVLDRTIGEGIEAALERMEPVDADRIDVEVTDGVVRLTGDVPNQASLLSAEDAARHSKGVIEVYNELRVQ
jgi:osmotically-inducible protein OsmY